MNLLELQREEEEIQRILEANLDLTYQAFSTGSNTELNTAAKDCE